MTTKQKENRHAKAATLLNNLKHEMARMFLFFRRKELHTARKVNRRNHRYLIDDPMKVPII